jgi:HlyD family secretion protein
MCSIRVRINRHLEPRIELDQPGVRILRHGERGEQLLSTEFTLDHKADTEYRTPLSTLTDHSDTASMLPVANQEPNHRALAVPAVITPRQTGRRRWLRAALALALIVLAAAAGGYWWEQNQARLPAGIAWGNGRIEADEIDIGTKFPGRIAEMLADQGDMVKAGQIVARMDTRDLEASLKKAQAQVRQAQRAVEEANANVAQHTSLVLLAKQQMDRAAYLVQRGAQTKEVLDQRQQVLDGANAALKAATTRVTEAEHALEAATHDVELYTVQIADNTLVVPRDGRIQYRVANIGEVLPAGGKVFTMLDVSYVYMDIYLPTEAAGKVRFGADARIVLDAYPNIAIPAKVTFIATQAQFTPKTVETQSERDKLMFRIRVRIDPERLRGRAAAVRSGLPGVAYVLTDPTATWPAKLQGTAPQ